VTAVIAHRGASAIHLENTVAAFAAAREVGADGVELDARRTADGRLVVHHDSHLPDGRVVVETPAAELPPHVPSLAEALDACAGLRVNIEVKNLPGEPDFDETESVAAGVVELVDRRQERDAVLVSSFNLASIDWIRRADPGVATAFLVLAADAAAIALTVDHGHGTIHPWDGLVDAPLVAAAHDAGLAINVWTVNDPGRMAELVAWGVDGIVTDHPDVARGVVDGSRD
jgi:glycerophosphoryl diester phosphodiesterase